MRLHSRSLAAALAATLLVAACGSDSDDTGAGSDSAETTVADTTPATTPETTPETTEPAVEDTTTTTEAPAQDVAADTATAQASLLTLAEFPEGWTETEAADRSAIEDSFAACIGVESLTSTEASATSGGFSSPDSTLVVAETVGVQATERDARFVLAGITNPDVPGCLAGAYNELGAAALSAGAVADGSAVGEATGSRLAVGSAGDSTQAIRIEIPVGDSTITVDHVIARSGRSIAALTYEGRVAATPVETIDTITEAAASKLTA